MRLWLKRRAKHPPKKWFQDEDGTYYRNCPLIMAEQDAVLAERRVDFDYYDELAAEWDWCFAHGVMRSDVLPEGALLVVPRPFREVYPNEPGLWVLDEVSDR